MSNEDQYGGGDGYGEIGGTGQTRTRLPDAPSDPYGTPRRTPRASRGLVTVVGVVVLLIAAIAFANQSGDTPTTPSADTPPAPASTQATGTRPVDGKNGGIPKGFAHDEQGAQSAAANYAVALGSDVMFKKNSRHALVDGIYTPDAAARLKGPQDEAYSAAFLAKLGLDANGNPPQDSTFVTRTVPVGTRVDNYSATSAKISVWYTGLIGMSGPKSTDPVRTTWKTWTFELTWAGDDWKVLDDDQKDGPAPVPGDVAASTSDDISKATKEFGGFTYAR
ncbi:membrane protein [Streptomyces sp. NRRL S-444]|nr:membrane protein [Streptomyces sp. NRRL S-444]